MLNRVRSSKQCDKSYQRSGHRRTVQLGVSPGSQPNETGLRDAVHRLIAVSRACDGPDIEFCDDLVAGELQPELQRAMSSVVRELMLNAICHSRSKNTLVGIGQGDGYVFLQVQDWGAGFDPKRVPRDSGGLKRVRDLVRWLGGTMDIDSQHEAGTCVLVEVPLSRQSAANHPTTGLKPRITNYEVVKSRKRRSL